MKEQTIGSCDPRVRVPVAIATVRCRHGNRRVGDSRHPALLLLLNKLLTALVRRSLPVELVCVIYSNSSVTS